MLHRLKMLIPQWTFLAVSILWESESCSIEDFPLLPTNYGNYEGRTFYLVASVYECDCCQMRLEDGDLVIFKVDIEQSHIISAFDLSAGCNHKDLRRRLIDGELTTCFCENVYERHSWVLFVKFFSSNERSLVLGSLNQSLRERETKEYLLNWMEELNVPYHNTTPEVSILSCPIENAPILTEGQKVSLAWLLVILIPVFLLVISIITPTLKDYMARHSNRVHPFTP